jgi:hypothetical protein
MRNRSLVARSLIAIISSLALGACGGGGGSGGGAEGGASSGQETASELDGFDTEGFDATEPVVDHGQGSARELLGIQPPPEPWASMSYADREMHMVAYVLPIHAELFSQYDAAEYARFDCASCHGDDGPARRYQMPSRSLPPLPPEGSPRWAQASQRNPRAWAFMVDEVLPTMRTQLGQPELTCFSCHPRAGG